MKICCVQADEFDRVIVNTTGAFKLSFTEVFAHKSVHWIERSEAETDIRFKQIIPYVIIRNADNEFACYPRHGTETRLHGLYSCGIGGHIDYTDKADTLLQTVHNGMERELSEEFRNFNWIHINLKYKGIINDAETKVGAVHLGLVFFADCLNGYLPEPSDELAGLQWMPQDKIKNVQKELWSELAFKFYDNF